MCVRASVRACASVYMYVCVCHRAFKFCVLMKGAGKCARVKQIRIQRARTSYMQQICVVLMYQTITRGNIRDHTHS